MGDVRKISRKGALEAIDVLTERHEELLSEWKAFQETYPRRPNVKQKEQRAYLHGRINGVFSAIRIFEGKSPTDFTETD